GLLAYAGDRSVVVHWDRSLDPTVTGYFLYGAASGTGPFSRLTARVRSPSFAHLQVTNGQPWFYHVRAVNAAAEESAESITVSAEPREFASDGDFLAYLQRANFDYFWYEANPTNGLVADRNTPTSPCSIAAVGFGLSAINVGIDNGWITRAQGRSRVHTTLRTFWEKPQGSGASGIIGHRGWFYHFLDMRTAARTWACELSSIDTALLLAGVLDAREYFDGPDAEEVAIRTLADALFGRVDWDWMRNGQDSLTMGWKPDTGFLPYRWIGYNEAMVLYLMGLGASTNPLPAASWAAWTGGYTWRTNYGHSYVPFPPLFGHQYSHCWVDFRHTADAYMRGRGITYFENSRRATLAQQAYCIANPGRFSGYSSNVWGLTACDGPGTGGIAGYNARGAPPPQNDDGTLAPTAVGGSVAFAPEICVPTLRHLYDHYRTNLWTGYGFRDAFNLRVGWWDPDTLGIDQGPIVLMIENHLNERVWRRFMRVPEIRRGLERAGFVPVTSVSATITAEPLAGPFTVTWPTTVGVRYQVEYSPDLERWWASPTGTLTAEESPLSWLDAGPPATETLPRSVPRRFYRVFEWGPP
ncbi:MAG: glucoamylase family protein, partial [Limisphaerales bacterium]